MMEKNILNDFVCTFSDTYCLFIIQFTEEKKEPSRYLNFLCYYSHSNLLIKKALKKRLRAFNNVPGDYLLSHAGFPRSTIGAIGLNFRVRDGIGCNSYAMITGEISGN